MIKLVVFSCLILSSFAGKAGDWGYRNDHNDQANVLPTEWKDKFSTCYGHRQSPINVDFRQTVYDDSLKSLTIKRLDDENVESWDLNNNGGTVKLTTNKKYQFTMKSEDFKFLQMHFHWRGSEHFVNGHKFAGELHLVHQSMNNSGKYAVIGFLMELTDNDNSDLDPIINNLKLIKEANTKTSSSDISIDKLVPTNVHNYYRYPGSLTTPGCDEVVEWILVDKPVLGISENQILEFQSLRDKQGYPILTNSRPIQNLSSRQVKRSFQPSNSRILKAASGTLNSSSQLSHMNAIYLAMIVYSTKYLFNC